MLLLLLLLLASSSYAEDSDCRDVFDDTCFIKVENEIASIFADLKANDEGLSREHLRDLCRYFDHSLECVSGDIEYDCSEDVKREFLELSVESLRIVAEDFCKDQYKKLRDVFRDIECWDIDDLLRCTERRANVHNIMYLLQRPVGGEECLNFTQDIESCLDASKTGSCREHKGIQSMKELVGIFREEQCKNIKPKGNDVRERTASPIETSEAEGGESASSEINFNASDVTEIVITSTEITTKVMDRMHSFSEANVSSLGGLERRSTSTKTIPSASQDREKEGITVGTSFNITDVTEQGGTSSTADSNFSQVADEKNSATENKSNISEVAGAESTPSQASTVTREFTRTRSTFVPAIITSKFTETVSAVTSELSGIGSPSSQSTHTNSEATGNGGTFAQDSTITTSVKSGRGTFAQTSLTISDVTKDGTQAKSDISQVVGNRTSASPSFIEVVEIESATVAVNPKFAMRVKNVEATKNGGVSKKATTSLTFKFCFMMMLFLFLV